MGLLEDVIVCCQQSSSLQPALIGVDLPRPLLTDSQEHPHLHLLGCNGRREQCHQQERNYNLTATPSAAGRTPPCLVTPHLLKLYHECVDNCGWIMQMVV